MSLAGRALSGACSAVSRHSWVELWPWPGLPRSAPPSPLQVCARAPGRPTPVLAVEACHWDGSQQLCEMSPAHLPTCQNGLLDISSGWGGQCLGFMETP